MASTKILTVDEVDAALEEVENEIGATSGEIDTGQIRTMVSEALRRRNDRAFPPKTRDKRRAALRDRHPA
jgi:hypothetical protein